MGKIFSWVIIGVLVWAAWKLVLVSQRKQQARRDMAAGQPGGGGQGDADGPAAGSGRKPALEGELMVRCARCGVYLPDSEALAGGDHRYCSAEHRLAGPG